MKRCPECRRDYFDDSLMYCLDDGAALLEGPSISLSEHSTAILPTATTLDDAKTRTFDDALDAKAERKNRRWLPIVAASITVVVLAIGGYFYYNGRPSSQQLSAIAVMPFVNASGAADLEYLSDGMTESLMNSLSQLPNVSIKARSTVFRYKGKEVEPSTVGKELNVQAILNGRVTQRGDQITLSLDLVDARTGDQIWGQQYNRRMGDVAALQSEIARDVSSKLRQRLTGEQEKSVTKNQTQNSEAYQLYLQGRYLWNKRDIASNKKAIDFFQKAIEKDPAYAMAYVGLAECYITGFLSTKERRPLVEGAANKALAIDPTLGEPHAVLGVIRISDFQYADGEAEFRKAIELSPNYASTYHWYGEALAVQGRFDESFAQFKKALELDPLSLAISTDLGRAYYLARQYDRAIEHLRSLLVIDPSYVRTHFYLANVYQDKGLFDESLEEISKGMLLLGEDRAEIEKGIHEVRAALKASGSQGYWKKLYEFERADYLRNFGGASSLSRAAARLGNRDEAFSLIDKAISDDGDGAYMAFKVSPDWDNLRDDPRFPEVLKRVGF